MGPMRAVVWAVLALSACCTNAALQDEAYRLHPAPNQAVEEEDAKFYARFADGAYHFHLVPPPGGEIRLAELFFDLDQNTETEQKQRQKPQHAGADLYATVTQDVVEIYHNCFPAQKQCTERVDRITPAFDSSNGALTFLANSAYFGGKRDIDIALRLSLRLASGKLAKTTSPRGRNNYHALYADLDHYLSTPCHARGDGELRSAVVFDPPSKEAFYDQLSYVQLQLALQSQVRQLMPVDVVYTENMLNIAQTCRYSAIIIPQMTNVDVNALPVIRKALFILNAIYGVGICTSGEFLNYDAKGNYLKGQNFFMMRQLIGLQGDGVTYAKRPNTVVQVSSPKELFWDFEVGQQVMDSDSVGLYQNFFRQSDRTARSIRVAAIQVIPNIANSERNAILLSEMQSNVFGRRSGRIVHFATESILGNGNLGGRAVQWITALDFPEHMSLTMSRAAGGIFTCRNDMDQSQLIKEAGKVEPAVLEEAVLPWYQKYNFVASYYINIGNEPKRGKYTKWDWARDLYGQYVASESEMGSHSFTHPMDVNKLSDLELKFEFQDSSAIIAEELGLDRIGSAQPGNPPNLEKCLKMEEYFNETYFSGGYSSVDAGFPNAFGYLTPESSMVFVAPNMQFDFSLGLLNKNPKQMEAIWKYEMDHISFMANAPVYHWPIHDYAVTEWDDNRYKLHAVKTYSHESMEHTIQYAAAKGTEFITTIQLSDRIRFNTAASLSASVVNSEQLRVKVSLPQTSNGSTPTLGHHALKLEHPQGLRSLVRVEGYYAYTHERVLLPKAGGNFLLSFGGHEEARQVGASITRIVDVGMRMELLHVAGDGTSLSFSVNGKGVVKVRQADSMTEMMTEVTSDCEYEATWDASDSSDGTREREMVFHCTSMGSHDVSIQEIVPTMAPTFSPSYDSMFNETQDTELTMAPTSNPSYEPTFSETDYDSTGYESTEYDTDSFNSLSSEDENHSEEEDQGPERSQKDDTSAPAVPPSSWIGPEGP